MSAVRPGLTLHSRTLHALKWSSLGARVWMVSQLAVGVLLAHLPGPGPFGAAAAAWVVIGTAGLFAGLGFSAARIQRESLERNDVRFTFTCQVLLDLGLMGVGILSAKAMDRHFREPRAVTPLRAMFLAFVLKSFGLISGSVVASRSISNGCGRSPLALTLPAAWWPGFRWRSRGVASGCWSQPRHEERLSTEKLATLQHGAILGHASRRRQEPLKADAL